MGVGTGEGLHPFARDLDRNAANYVPLSPVSFLERSAFVYPGKVAVRHGAAAWTYARVRRALPPPGLGAGAARHRPRRHGRDHGAQRSGDARGALRGAGARRDPQSAQHPARRADDRVLPRARRGEGAADRRRVRAGRARRRSRCSAGRSWSSTSTMPKVRARRPASRLGAIDLRRAARRGRPALRVAGPARRVGRAGAALHVGHDGRSQGRRLSPPRRVPQRAGQRARIRARRRQSVYLWTLPMFHCNGWTYTWAVTAAGGTHVCLRRVDPAPIFRAIAEHRVTHLCGAPVVLNLLVHAPEAVKAALRRIGSTSRPAARRRRRRSSRRWRRWASA